MPLNATFLADFSSFITATQKAVQATADLQAAAGKVGPAYDIAARNAADASDEAAKAADKVLENSYQLGKQIGDNLKDITRKTAEFSKPFIDAFAESQRSVANLALALKNAGAPPDTLKSYQDMAEHLSNMSRYSKESITGVQSLFTSVGGIKPDQMQAALTATLDLAAGLAGTGQKMSLEQAAKLVTTAAASNGESIGRLKRILGDAYDPAKGFAGIMEAVESKFHGAAADDVKTYAGSVEHLKNQMNDLDEKVGAVIVPTLEKMLGVFQQLPKPVQETAIGIGAIGKEAAPVLLSISSLVTLLGKTGLGGAIAAFATSVGGALVAGFETLMAAIGPVGWVILGLTAVGVAIWHWRDDIKAALDSAWDEQKRRASVWADALKPITDAVMRTYTDVKTWLLDKLTGIFDAVSDRVKNFTATTVDWFKRMYMQLVGGSIVPDTVKGIAKEFSKLDDAMVKPAQAASAQVVNAFNTLAGAWGPAASGMSWAGATGIGQSVASQFVRFPLMFGGSTSGLTETPLGSVVTINMQGLLMTDDPGARAQLRDAISDALMPAMKSSRLLGST